MATSQRRRPRPTLRGLGECALPGTLPVTWSKLVSPAPNFTNPLIYSIPLGPTALNLATLQYEKL